MSPVLSFLLFAGILLCIDFLIFLLLKKAFYHHKYWKIIFLTHVSVTALFLFLLFFFYFIYVSYLNAEKTAFMFLYTAQLIPLYIFKLLFVLFSLCSLFIKIYRQKIIYIAFGATFAFFLYLQYGYWFGRFNYTIYEQNLTTTIPNQFKGLKIVQISDLHLGTVVHHDKKLEKMVALVNEQQPDLVFLTGDLVNFFAQEAYPFVDQFAKIKAKYGVFAVNGNHDYGDYYRWRSDKDKELNLRLIDSFYLKTNIKLLSNTNAFVEKNNEKIWIAGVENMGIPPFKSCGDISKALKDIPDSAFILFLSHDPSIWDNALKTIPRLAITFSGHTHGFQFGTRNGKKPWSPLVWSNIHSWCGLYEYENRLLYVNVGQSGSFFPARLGMWPEITVFTLK
jgi:predicted MPP superfamily phosphohydrolase